MVTLQDVAHAAGVSIATASWAVNDNKDVRIPEETKKRVRRIAKSMGYRRNALASGLARGRSDSIGFISDGVATSPFAGQVIRGAQDEAWRNGKILLVVDTNGDSRIEHSALSFMLERQVEGIVYSSWVHHEVVPPKELRQVNSVLVNCYDRDSTYPAVVPDEVQGGLTATNLLIAAGHKRIAFINQSESSPASVGRLRGYRQALEQAQISFDPSLVIFAKADQEGGYGAVDALMKTGATAVFCHNDRTAMGLYDALRERGVRVPDHLSVVGFDNQEVIAAHLHPGLTTVALPQYDLGVLGVRMLLEPSSDRKHSKDAESAPAVRPGPQDLQEYQPVHVSCPSVVRRSIAVPAR